MMTTHSGVCTKQMGLLLEVILNPYGKWMVNGLHLYSAFIQSALQLASHSPIHTHIHTPLAEAATQGANLLNGSN